MEEEKKIEVTTPTEATLDDRFNQYWGEHAFVVEQFMYAIADKISGGDYQGGVWRTAVIDPAGLNVPVRLLDQDAPLQWENEGNFSHGTTDPATFSMAVNAYVCSHLSFMAHDKGNDELAEKLARAYHAIRDAVYTNDDKFNAEHYWQITD